MKKILFLSAVLALALSVQAQSPYDPLKDRELIFDVEHVLSVLLVLLVFVFMFVYIIRFILDHRLKMKLIEKGPSEEFASRLLETSKRNRKEEAFRWFSLSAGIGIGLLLIQFFQPLGIHSFAIMAFCLAASYLAYSLWLTKAVPTEKEHKEKDEYSKLNMPV